MRPKFDVQISFNFNSILCLFERYILFIKKYVFYGTLKKTRVSELS